MDDAELAFSTAHHLILKLAKHKAKVSPDPPQTMKAWDEVLARLTHLNKICPNPPDEVPAPPQSRKRPASEDPSNPPPDYMFHTFIQGGQQSTTPYQNPQSYDQNTQSYDPYGYQYLQSQQKSQKQPLVVRRS